MAVVLALAGCGPSDAVRAARSALEHHCASSGEGGASSLINRCGVGEGSCYYDEAAEAMVCLCDRGCRVLTDE